MLVKIMVPFLGTLKKRCRIIMGTQKGTLILTTTHINNLTMAFRGNMLRSMSISADNSDDDDGGSGV